MYFCSMNWKKYLVIAIFIAFQHVIFAQIVNVESLRLVGDTSKWSGFASLSVSFTKNKNRIFLGNGKLHAQYLYKKHLGLIVGTTSVKEANKQRLVGRGILHLRYNYRFHKHIAWEAFGQAQYDHISALDYRQLIGTGPRFKLTKSDKYRFYLGVLAMYEYEEIDNPTEQVIQNDFRGSAYFSFSLHPNKNTDIVSTTYYQPRLNQLGDFRISNDTSIAFKIAKNLAFSVGITYFYDEFPPVGVPREQYKLLNGITYSFN